MTSKYRSRFEKEIADRLKSLSVSFSYETEKIQYKVEEEKTYTPDFILSNGIVIEAKGYFRAGERKKYLQIKKSNPDLDLRFVFQNANNKINKRSKTTYAQWAEKNGFKWADKTIPMSWLEE